MGNDNGANHRNDDNYVDYRGQYEAQDLRAVVQPVPQAATDYPTSTMTNTMTGYANESAGYPRTGNGVAVEHAGPGFAKVEQSRNF